MRNFNFILLLVAVFTVVGLSGCGPYPTEQAVEVKNNETAFVVPLEGDSKSKQAQFMSIEYLEKAKVATKRIVIPLRKRSLGRAWFDYEWIPLARVIVVDRSPVTREWLDKEGIKVESLDSVGFTVGVNCTGMIREEDAAKFLYYYPGNSLADVMNKNVKGFIQNVLAREFGSRDLSVCQKEKKNIVLDLAKELETAQATIEEQKDKYLRLSAEFDNYRKRTMKEKAELIKNGGEKAISAILPILDDLERALGNMQKTDDIKAVQEGIDLIYQKFLKNLSQEGLEKMNPIGEAFDTDYHEAVALVPAPEENQKGKILDCVQTGYKLNDKVIRHAKVVVAQ